MLGFAVQIEDKQTDAPENSGTPLRTPEHHRQGTQVAVDCRVPMARRTARPKASQRGPKPYIPREVKWGGMGWGGSVNDLIRSYWSTHEIADLGFFSSWQSDNPKTPSCMQMMPLTPVSTNHPEGRSIGHTQTRPMGLPYMPISWGGLRGQCRHTYIFSPALLQGPAPDFQLRRFSGFGPAVFPSHFMWILKALHSLWSAFL